jgi:predicted metal-dependent enzyme (double-stranded beta helix superfamily)
MKTMADRSERMQAVDATVARIKGIVGDDAVTRQTLASVLEQLVSLAQRRELWSAADFPEPEAGERQARYLVREDDDRSFALYLNVMRRGKRTPTHNHTTWACIAAVEGSESNYLFQRHDDGSRPGYADVSENGKVVVRPGSGIALMPDDIHAVEIEDDDVIRHLHLYGRALETLDSRLAFDLAAKTSRVMDIGVQTRRA